ncbi:hypothetical protein [Spongiactinospora gelatinilytica]|uniref:hypothetical protein n=1 Tax=Spongiactinospora gelatinilytica TaxID=2666298 RepID=UPI0034D19DE1
MHGSKSCTNRFITRTVEPLGHVEAASGGAASTIEMEPSGRAMWTPDGEVHTGNAGTGPWLLTTMSALAVGRTIISGDQRIRERLMGHLLQALDRLSLCVVALCGNGSTRCHRRARRSEIRAVCPNPSWRSGDSRPSARMRNGGLVGIHGHPADLRRPGRVRSWSGRCHRAGEYSRP